MGFLLTKLVEATLDLLRQDKRCSMHSSGMVSASGHELLYMDATAT